MKKNVNVWLEPVLFLGLGCLGAWLRGWVLRYGLDEKGLLLPWSGGCIGLLVLTVLTVALAWYFRKPQGALPLAEAAGELAMGAGCLSVLPGLLEKTAPLDTAHLVLAAAAGAGLLLSALSRLQKKNGLFAAYALCCLFMAVHLVDRYQLWSRMPQFQRYFFPLAGSLAVLGFSCLRCRKEKGVLRRFLALAGGAMCLTALTGSDEHWLLAGGAAWLLTSCNARGETSL